ncbi:hypothetical protein QU481_03785 [Crenobacter sp. SG2303]|uniref:Chitin-binding type-2 domain-containing protein n=1 Tax=Crenobacter oryzisoli TaxID=3056844 RepID=A0ABT7XJP1_9NEIS|nr:MULTISPECIES: hypothetical protein [unclassified Crenobacter]MDN0074010.1 hypothetical protein [Crenobacter sp. SG2303]MDN0085438.1 hypothetical protein [Crenobacter sp. SG2305]
MKWLSYLVLGAALLGPLAAPQAEAHGHTHVVIGFGVGPIWGFGPYPYYPPPYYYPPPAVVVTTPPVYVQQQDAPSEPGSSNYWYYCNNPQGYYPYVKTCPAGWQQVTPQPPQ